MLARGALWASICLVFGACGAESSPSGPIEADTDGADGTDGAVGTLDVDGNDGSTDVLTIDIGDDVAADDTGTEDVPVDVEAQDVPVHDIDADDVPEIDVPSDDIADGDTADDTTDTGVLTDDAPPQIVVLTPSSGAAVTGGSVIVTGTVSDPAGENGVPSSGGLELWIGGAQVPLDGDAFTWTVTGLAPGATDVRFSARDAANNTSEVKLPLTVSPMLVGLRIVPPVISIGDLDVPTTVRVEALWDGARVSPPDGATPDWAIADDEVASFTTFAGGQLLLKGVGPGATTLTVSWDGQSASADVMVRTDSEAPMTPRLLTYLPETDRLTQAWMGSAEPGATLIVTGGASPLSTVVDESGAFNLTVPLVFGENLLEVTLTDAAGNSTPPLPFPIMASQGVSDAGRLHESRGDQQRAHPGDWLHHPLVVRATRKDGDPLAMANITFEVVTGDAWLATTADGTPAEPDQGAVPSNLVVMTGPDGRAAVAVRLGTAERTVILARLDGDTGLPVVFEARLAESTGTSTTLRGLVLDDDMRGVPGATVLLETQGLFTTTDERGAFEVTWPPGAAPTGPVDVPLYVDGTSASTGLHAAIEFRETIVPGSRNVASRPFFIPRLPAGIAPVVDANGVVLETLIIEGQPTSDPTDAPALSQRTRITVPAGTRIVWPAGLANADKVLRVVDVRQGRTPMPLPDGLYAGRTIAVQPASTIFEPPLPVALPNVDGLPPGERVVLMSFDHDALEYIAVGDAAVSPDGSVIESLPGSGIRIGAWHSAPPRRAQETCEPHGNVTSCGGASSAPPRDCMCIGPSGKAFPCQDGRPFAAPPQPCSGQNQRIEVACDLPKKKKAIEITSPSKDSSGIVKTTFDLALTYEVKTNPPELAATVKWFLGESAIGTGKTIPITLPSGTVPGKTYVVTAQLADGSESDRILVRPCPCFTVGSLRACGDTITQTKKAGIGGEGDVFEVSGNVTLSNGGDQYLRSSKPVTCVPKLSKITGDGRLSMDTVALGGRFAIPDIGILEGDFELDATNGEITIAPDGRILANILGFQIIDPDKAPVMGGDGVTFPLPSISLSFKRALEGAGEFTVKFDAIGVTTARITLSGEFSYVGEARLRGTNIYLKKFLVKYDAAADVFAGAVGLAFGDQPAQWGFELEGSYRDGLVKSIKGTLIFGATPVFPNVRGLPIVPTGTPPAAFLRKASLAIDNPGYFIGKGSKNDLPAVTGGAEFSIGPAFATACDEYTVALIEGEVKINTKPIQIDVSAKGGLLRAKPIALCSPFIVFGAIDEKAVGPSDDDLGGLVGIEGKVSVQLKPSQRASVEAAARVGLPGADGDVLVGKVKVTVDFTQGYDLIGEASGVLRLPEGRIGPFKYGGVTIGGAKMQLASGAPPIRFNIELVASVPLFTSAKFYLKISNEGVKLKLCFANSCTGSIELSRAVFEGPSHVVDVPPGLAAAELSVNSEPGAPPVLFGLRSPDGVVHDPESPITDGALFVTGLEPGLSTWYLQNPTPGAWQLVDVTPMGAAREVILALPDQAPTVAFTGPLSQAGDLVTAPYAAADADSDAELRFIASPTRSTADGVVVGTAAVSDGETAFEWDTSTLPRGAWFLCIAADDPTSVSVSTCTDRPIVTTGPLTGTGADGPRQVLASPVPGGLVVTWLGGDPDAGARVHFTPQFDGETVDATSIDGRTEAMELIPGAPYLVQVIAGAARSEPVLAIAGGPAIPVFTSEPPITAMTGVPWTYQPVVTAGGALSLELGPAGAAVASGVLSMNFTSPGSYDVALRASGSAGSTVQRFTVQVASTDGSIAPLLLGRPAPLLTVGQAWSFTPTLHSVSGDATLALTVGPTGMVLDDQTGTLSWTPSVTSGSDGFHPIVLTATGPDGVTTERTWVLRVLDVDGDGLSDAFERGSGLNPAAATSPTADPDGDGLTHAAEDAAGTAGDRDDTDGDTLQDDAELLAGSDPRRTDTDGDGLDDAAEATIGSSPLLVDSDGDGLSDLDERDVGTAPDSSVDGDDDGLPDDVELSLGFDPAAVDADADGLNDAAELAAGTDPRNADTDGDGVSDSAELAFSTDPTKAGDDLDGDGLSGDRELAEGSDPALADSDGDGVLDGMEVALGSDPADVADAVALEQPPLEPAKTEKAVGQSQPTPFRPFETVDVGEVICRLDDDLDGADNDFELAFGFSSTDPSDGDNDDDDDGVPLWMESRLGTDPTKADSDGDEVPDGQEHVDGTDPTDPTSFSKAGPLIAIDVAPTRAALVSNTMLGTATVQLLVTGRRENGPEVDVTAAAKGTTYVPANAGLVAVSPDGRVSHVAGAGSSTIQVKNGTLTASIPVAVTPFTPVPVGVLELDGPVGPVVAASPGQAGMGPTRVALIDGTSLVVVDARDPAAMAIAGRINLSGLDASSSVPARAIAMTGDLVYVAGTFGVAAVSLATDPLSLVEVIPLGAAANGVVAPSGGLLYVATDAGLETVRPRGTAGMTGLTDGDGDGKDDRVVGSNSGTTSYIAVDAAFGRVVALSAASELAAFSVLAGDQLGFLGQTTLTGSPRGVRLDGTTAFAATGGEVRRVRVAGAPVLDGATTGMLAAGPLGRYRSALLVGRETSNALVGFVATGLTGSLPTLGSIDSGALADVSFARGLAVSGPWHFVTARSPLDDRDVLIANRHDLEVDLLGVPPTLAWVAPMALAPPAPLTMTEGTTFTARVVATDDVGVASSTLQFGDSEPIVFDGPPGAVLLTAPGVTTTTVIALTASATDVGGNTATLPPLMITVTPVIDVEPPAVAILSPVEGAASSAGATVNVDINAVDDLGIARLVVRLDGQIVLDTPSDRATFPVVLPAQTGGWLLEATATDVGGNSAVAQRVIEDAGTNLVALGVSHIADGDTTFDGQSVVIAGGSVRIDGAHTFERLTVAGDGVLTHTAATITTATRLAITANSITIDGAIDVRGKGYLGGCLFDPGCTGTFEGRTVGNTSGATGSASHGGTGRGNAGSVYGDFRAPVDLGSGGGNGGLGGAGGGAVQLSADTLVVRGVIDASAGETPGDHDANVVLPDIPGHGGSGGSVWLNARLLEVAGTVRARGGDSTVWPTGTFHGGGGGRIALVASESASVLGTVDAGGGASRAADGRFGASGTVFAQNPAIGALLTVDDAVGDIDNPVFGSTPSDVPVGGADLDVIIRGSARISLPAPLLARSLSLEDTTRLVHAVTGKTTEPGLRVTVQDLMVAAGAGIDVSGRGYPGSTTLGNTLNANGAAGIRAGGSHGGLGGGLTGRAYGDPLAPYHLGAGGGRSGENSGHAGGAGGGRVRVTAESCLIDGTVLSDGVAGTDTSAGGGAGGSIWLECGLLEGDGTVRAAGGLGGPTATAGGGAGGRVRIGTDDASAFDLTRVTAPGVGLVAGGPGTVLLAVGPGVPRLRIDNGGLIHVNATGPLSQLGGNRVNGAPAAGSDKVAMLLATDVLTDQLIGAEAFFGDIGPFPVVGNTLTELTVDTGGVGLAALGVKTSMTIRLTRALPVALEATGGARVLFADRMTLGGLTVDGGAVLFHAPAKTTEVEPKLDLVVDGDVLIGAEGTIDVTARGYAGQGVPTLGTTGGGTTFGNAVYFLPKTISGSGGSYGGLGAGISPGDVYGGPLAPSSCGGGGGSGATTAAAGGTGGGRVAITAEAVTIAGVIRADGGPSGTGGDQKGGGGAGGAIWIDGSSIDASGTLSATGGDGGGGGGGGGRIHLIARDGALTASPTALGGDGPLGRGGPGTVAFTQGGATTVTIDGSGDETATPGPLAVQFGRRLATTQFTSGEIGVTSAGPWLPDALVGLEIRCAGVPSSFTVTSNTQTLLRVDVLDGETKTITTGAQCWAERALDAAVVVKGAATLIADDHLLVDALTVQGATLTHTTMPASTGGDGMVAVTATTSITLEDDAIVDVSGRGYAGDCVFNVNCGSGGFGLANRQNVGSKQFSGGSHGGKGGGPTSAAVNDSESAPTLPGGGGGRGTGATEKGGSGGGAIWLTAATLTLNGTLRADGNAAVSAGAMNGGAGAGGTIRLDGATLTGTATVSARGGSSPAGGGGGGGRIAILGTNASGWVPVLVDVGGGAGGLASLPDGAAGTATGVGTGP